MKVAYLVQAHNNYLHLQRLINALDDGGCDFYIHIDKKAAMPAIKGDNIFFLKNRVNVNWAGFSQVKATLRLIKAASKNMYDYYALISGADYPVKHNNYLKELLQNGGEFIDIHEGYARYFPKSRYRFFYFTDYYNRRNKDLLKTRIFMRIQTLLRQLHITKQVPFKIYHGASWFILSNACIKYIIKAVDGNNKLVSFFKYALSPDEAFFQTIIGNSNFLNDTKPFLTYADWSVSPGPATITEKHLEILQTEPYKFFARKFTDNSFEVVELINKELRNNPVINA